MPIDLRTKKSVPSHTPKNGDSVGKAPCIFCGKKIGHVNDYRDWHKDEYRGCIAGALVDGKVRHYLYCNDPLCAEHQAAIDRGEGITTCSCEDYQAYDVVVGYKCHVCKQPPCEPEDDRAYAGYRAAQKKKPQANSPKCPWCDEVSNTDPETAIIVTGLEEGSGTYCSSDCLFHWLLSDRTDEATFTKVQELINLPRGEANAAK